MARVRLGKDIFQSLRQVFCSVTLSLLLWLIVCSFVVSASDDEYTDYELHEGAIINQQVVEFQNASLPCDVNDPPTDDRPALILWYMDDEETPVYSFDQRDANKKGTGWADPIAFGDTSFPSGIRVQFHKEIQPPTLTIYNVSHKDARKYRCRIDYVKTTSKFAQINLRVIVPPKKIDILRQISPIMKGESNDVICHVSGAIPPASVMWLQRGKVVDANYNVSSGDSYNVLETKASRKDILEHFLCTANNNDITAPLTKSYLRNVTCGPLSMKVTSTPEVLSAGVPGQLLCQVVGSNPPPVIKWFQHGKMLNSTGAEIMHGLNASTSTLNFTAKKSDHKSQVVCRAENNLLPLSTLEDIINLKVTYSPEVTLQVGWPADPTQSKFEEGSDVFLECVVNANPNVYKVSWYKNGKLLPHRDAPGMKTKNSLVLANIQRKTAGIYQCGASNVIGDNRSNNQTVIVEYAPFCAHPPISRGIALNSPINVTCRVDSDPPPSTYSWTFVQKNKDNQGSSHRDWEYTKDGFTSTLYYVARTSNDYGTLKCSAFNKVSRQRKPCIFKIAAAGPPESIANCLVVNITANSASITCQKGFNGGAQQRFIVQVKQEVTQQIVSNRTIPDCAFFRVPKLRPQLLYSVSVIAFNKYGRSVAKIISLRTQQVPPVETRLTSEEESSSSGWIVGLVIGILLMIGIIIAGVIFFLRPLKHDNVIVAKEKESPILRIKRPLPKLKIPQRFKLEKKEKPPPSTPIPVDEDEVDKTFKPDQPKEGRSFLKTSKLVAVSKRSLSKKDSVKEGPSDQAATALNGAFEYTIYDASGRYKGFSHLPQQIPGCRYPMPITTGQPTEKPEVPKPECNNHVTEEGPSSGSIETQGIRTNSVRLRGLKGWAKIRDAFIFMRNSSCKMDIKKLVSSRSNIEPSESESKI